MATKVFLRDSTSEVTVGSETKKVATLIQGSALVSTDATATVGGPTSGIQLKKNTVLVTWYSNPLRAITISGTITFNLWALESASQANTGLDVLVEHCDQNGNVLSTIVRSEQGTELGTSATARNWTANPTSTALNEGDRIKITVFGNDAGGNMGSARTFTMNYGAGTGVNGDSYIQFTETLNIGVVANQLGSGNDLAIHDAQFIFSEIGIGIDNASVEELSVFPTIPVTDDFDRSDSGSLGTNWTDLWRPSGVGFDLVSNRARGKPGGDSHVYWNTNFGPDLQAFIQMIGGSSGNYRGLAFRLINEGTSSVSGYEIIVFGDAVGLYSWTNNSQSSAIGGTQSQTYNSGDWIGVKAVGSTIEVYYRPSGGSWGLLFSRTDGTHNSTGKVGIRSENVDWDNFGVGTVSGDANQLASEIGIGLDNVSVSVSTSGSETGAGTESVFVSLIIDETFPGFDESSIFSSIEINQFGFGIDNSFIQSNVTAPETLFGDTSQVSGNVTSSESFPGIDAASSEDIGGGTNSIFADEFGIGIDSTFIEASLPLSEPSPLDGIGTVEATTVTNESVPGTDLFESISQLDASENLPGIESIFVDRFAFVNESIPGTESTSISISFSTGESGIGIDSASVIESGSEKEVFEGSIPDSVVSVEGQIPIVETFNGAETITIQSNLSVSETGVLSDVSSVDGLITVTEGFSSTEVVQTSADISASELGAGTDFANVQIPGSALASEGVPGTESVFITVEVFSSEIGVGTDFAKGIPIILASENAPGIDEILISPTITVSEGVPGIDSVFIGSGIFVNEGVPGFDSSDISALILTGEFGVGSESILIGGNVLASQLGSGNDLAESHVYGTLTISGKVKMTVLNNGKTFASVSKQNTTAIVLNNGKTSCEVTNG